MMAESKMNEFIKVLSSDAPVPGGGGASGYAAAIGMALGNMVASLTTGKKKYAEEQRHLSEMAQGDDIKELQLLMSGKFSPTISATDLSSLSDLKDIAHLQAQRALDNVLDCLVYHHCKKNGCDINGTY